MRRRTPNAKYADTFPDVPRRTSRSALTIFRRCSGCFRRRFCGVSRGSSSLPRRLSSVTPTPNTKRRTLPTPNEPERVDDLQALNRMPPFKIVRRFASERVRSCCEPKLIWLDSAL